MQLWGVSVALIHQRYVRMCIMYSILGVCIHSSTDDDEVEFNSKLAFSMTTTPNIISTSNQVGCEEHAIKFQMDEIWDKYHFHSNPDFTP